MRIVLVEDDYLQSDWMCQKLQQTIPDAYLDRVSTESEFRLRFDEIADRGPDIVVLDVMLRWSDPGPRFVPPPDDVEKEGFYRAGLRCERMLAADERTARIPVILYTVLEHADLKEELSALPEHVQYLSKHSDLAPLQQKIRELAKRNMA